MFGFVRQRDHDDLKVRFEILLKSHNQLVQKVYADNPPLQTRTSMAEYRALTAGGKVGKGRVKK